MRVGRVTILLGILILAITGAAAWFYANIEKYIHPLLLPPESAKVDEDKALRGQTRVFEIAGRKFEIPIMYIDGRPKPGEHQTSMLLEVVWPDMRSTREIRTRDEYDRIRKQERRVGWILLQQAHGRASLEDRMRLGPGRKQEAAGTEYGLEKYLWHMLYQGKYRLWSEIYVERDKAGNIITRIECTPKERGVHVRFPNCKQTFFEGHLEYGISYNMAAFLPEWREQKQRATEFMRSKEITPNQ